MEVKIKHFMLAAFLAFALAVASCGQQEQIDGCGYTWYDGDAPKADTVHFITVKSWADPGIKEGCRRSADDLNLHGCYVQEIVSDGTVIGFAYLHQTAQIVGGVCDTRAHEAQHGAGKRHREEHRYIPRDFTRR